ncbi:hypothetical protein [Pyxidicoccus xibeiensis]|uniref:hypothetical protein n=1 Tax=Pyxidicoccus xibeiensis TaxID=2906759 RepID=UPI0020A81A80|nr:hypothetical protein [Pyxidicoccus xibeiensis]MCP3137516.1 hypothetical protein [Pyxidicoccus xibeiensis]
MLLGVYLSGLELSPGKVGVVIGSGLAGAVLATLLADRLGRKRFLRVLSSSGQG